MKKSNTIAYKKALKFYERGEINKALRICDDEISNNINNSAIISLKGMILYLKGNLNEAKQVWKLNVEVNKDSISEKYLSSISKDHEKEALYLKALKLFNENKVRLAVEDLNKCLQSDFNTIDVNNLYASCAIKLAQYDKAILAIEKVLSIDKNNKEALYLKKSLVKLNVIKSNDTRKMLKISFISIIALILLIGSVRVFPSIKSKNIFSKNENVKEETSIKEDKAFNEEENKNDKQNVEEKDVNQKPLNREEILKMIESKDYKGLDETISEYDVNKLSVNEKVVYNSAIDFMKDKGIDLCYKEASKKIKENDFSQGNQLLSIAEKYAENSYLMEHIIYLKGSSNEKMGNVEEAINFYKSYVDKYKKGEYTEEVLYRLAVNYQKIDKETAKKYAKDLKNNFPKSMYNNSVIKNIIS